MRYLRPIFCVQLVLFVSLRICLADAGDFVDPKALHVQAVNDARDGNYDTAINTLERLLSLDPQSVELTYDYVTVLVWAGREEDALTIATEIPTQSSPRYLLLTLAKANRNLDRLERAEVLYDELLRRDDNDLDAGLGKALVTAEQDEFASANSRLAKMESRWPHEVSLLNARAYVYELQQDYLLAANYSRRVLKLDPQNEESARRLSLLSAKAGAPHLAVAQMEKTNESITPRDRQFIVAEQAAHQIRWGEIPVHDPTTRFVETDEAITLLNAALGREWETLNHSNEFELRLLFDYMVALRDRVRMKAVIARYESGAAQEVEFPSFALLAAGDAYLYEEQAAIARDIYLEVARLDPQNPNVLTSIFYAYIELDDFENAFKTLQIMRERYPPFVTNVLGKQQASYARYDTEMLRSLGLAYKDQHQAAQRRLEKWRDIAPDNNRIRATLAQIFRWRGWPNRSEKEIQRVLNEEPNDLGSELIDSSNKLSLAEYKKAEEKIDQLVEIYPENKQVQRLDRQWAVHNKRELAVNFRAARSDGPQIGTDDMRVDSYLFSSPINYQWRGFLHHHYSTADLPEGIPRHHRLGGGAEYRYRRGRVRGEVNSGGADNTRAGAVLSVVHHLNDHWEIDGVGEINTAEAPLRGVRNGLRGNRLGAAIVYRWSELQRASVAANAFDFNDGNERYSANANLERRLLNHPVIKLDGNLGIYGSHNSMKGVSYYNPDYDLSTDATFTGTWRTWRKYERHFYQRVKVSLGNYWQQDFGSNRTWAMTYEHDLSINDSLSLLYGVTRARRVFDGTPEFVDAVYANLNGRF